MIQNSSKIQKICVNYVCVKDGSDPPLQASSFLHRRGKKDQVLSKKGWIKILLRGHTEKEDGAVELRIFPVKSRLAFTTSTPQESSLHSLQDYVQVSFLQIL